MYRAIGANAHQRDVFENEAGLSLISHGTIIPQTCNQAISDELLSTWQSAIDKEHGSLLRKGTWTLVKRLPKMNVLLSKYVLHTKSSGQKTSAGRSWVSTGAWMKYMDTYSPVVNFITIRILLAIVAYMDLELD